MKKPTVHIKPRGNTWVINFYQDGIRKQKSYGTDKELAEKDYQFFSDRIKDGSFNILNIDNNSSSCSVKFSTIVDMWFSYHCDNEAVTESTRYLYKVIIRKHIIPELGDFMIGNISFNHIKSFIMSRKNESSSKTNYIKMIHMILNMIFSYAKRNGVIKDNPAGVFSDIIRTRKSGQKMIHVWSEADINRFLNILNAQNPVYKVLFYMDIFTGLRIGEINAIKVEDIDFNKKQIYIKRAIYRNKIVSPKNNQVRIVDIPDGLIDVLSIYLANVHKHRSEWLFTIDWRQPIKQNRIRRHFKLLCLKAGVPVIRFHDLRHTYASLLLLKNVDLCYIQSQLGHRNLKMLTTVYSHLIHTDSRGCDKLQQLCNCCTTGRIAV